MPRTHPLVAVDQDYRRFIAAHYWPALDGLRVISIVIVLVTHMGDAWVTPFNGSLGVVLFFVISGYLITSLLLREEMRNARVNLRNFYVRRAFRIAPMYFLGLGLASVLVLVGGFGDPRPVFLARLPLLATFNGELAPTGTFVHAWSLGVEEKFYIVWPLLAFGALTLRRVRPVLAPLLLAFCVIASFTPWVAYFGMYSGILAGCVLSLLMHSRLGFRVVHRLTSPVVLIPLFLLVSVLFVLDWSAPWNIVSDRSHAFFALAAALCFPAVVLQTNPVVRLLSRRRMAAVGQRTYGIYLFHPFCIDVLDHLIAGDQTNLALGLVRLALAFCMSLLVAEVLRRSFELPLIRLGRRLTDSTLPPGEVDAAVEARKIEPANVNRAS